MTTEVLIKANHGWPVRVTRIYPASVGGAETAAEPDVVPAGEQRSFFVYDGCDLRVHEIQPSELPPPAAAPPSS